MAENIRNNENIKGMNVVRNRERKLTQLTDDTTVFLKTERDIPNLMHELKRFSKISGLNLNMSKTQGLWLGNIRRQCDNIHGIDCSKTSIKLLGIHFSKNRQECLTLN